MDKVILVNEDWHGQIGVAKTYKDAVHYLIDNDWLNEKSEITKEDEEWISIKEVYGDQWQEEILSLDIDKFNTIFLDMFLLCEVEVYEAKK